MVKHFSLFHIASGAKSGATPWWDAHSLCCSLDLILHFQVWVGYCLYLGFLIYAIDADGTYQRGLSWSRNGSTVDSSSKVCEEMGLSHFSQRQTPRSPPASIVCSRSVFFSVWILFLLFIIFFSSNRIAPSFLFRKMEFTFSYTVTVTSLVGSLKEVLKSTKEERKRKERRKGGRKEKKKEGGNEGKFQEIKNSIKLRQLFWGCSYHISPCGYSKGLYIFFLLAYLVEVVYATYCTHFVHYLLTTLGTHYGCNSHIGGAFW